MVALLLNNKSFAGWTIGPSRIIIVLSLPYNVSHYLIAKITCIDKKSANEQRAKRIGSNYQTYLIKQ